MLGVGQKILDEQTLGGAKPADIQRHIDANPAAFRQFATALAHQMDGIGKVADRRDLKTAYEAASELDGQCENCHQTFWSNRAGNQPCGRRAGLRVTLRLWLFCL